MKTNSPDKLVIEMMQNNLIKTFPKELWEEYRIVSKESLKWKD